VLHGFFLPTHPLAPPYVPQHVPIPFVRATLRLPIFPDSNADTVIFLVDTGADMTVVHPDDADRLLGTEDRWQIIRAHEVIQPGGAGAGSPHYRVPAILYLLHDDQQIDTFEFTVVIAEPTAANRGSESLLGRDILAHYTSRMDGVESITLDTR
jgi:hypothetical protein